MEELVGMVERGELRLPEMQRRFVWRATRVRDLLDSLYRGYPSGTILLWETDEPVPTQRFGVQQADSPYMSARLLLDGQQRLTSLSAVIRGRPVNVRGRDKPIELLFNLEHPDDLEVVTEVNEDSDEGDDGEGIEDEADSADSTDDELLRRFNRLTFVLTTKKLERSPQWVKVSDVFKNQEDVTFLSRAGITTLADPRCTKYSQRLARLRDIRNYVYRMDVLGRQMTYEEVTEIFVRVNSLGAKLRSSDLALAQITAKWKNSLAIFEAFQDRCAERGFELDLGLYLRNMIAFSTGQSRFATVASLSARTLQAGWEQSCRGMEFAINFLKSNASIESPALLSSPFLLIVLGYFGHKRDYRMTPEESERLRFWALFANAKGRFSRGSSETILDQDIASLRGGASPETLVDRLRLQFGRLMVTPEELEGRNQRSALFKTMFLAFREAGARDWNSNLTIALDHSGMQHRLQFHHIFPKALLRSSHTSRQADDISNLAFIAGRTNREISDTSPNIYFAPLIKKSGTGILDAQCIPTEESLLLLSSYDTFLAERRRRIAERLNIFLAAEA